MKNYGLVVEYEIILELFICVAGGCRYYSVGHDNCNSKTIKKRGVVAHQIWNGDVPAKY